MPATMLHLRKSHIYNLFLSVPGVCC